MSIPTTRAFDSGFGPRRSYSHHDEFDSEDVNSKTAKKQENKDKTSRYTFFDIVKQRSESHSNNKHAKSDEPRKPKLPVPATEFFIQRLPQELQLRVWAETIDRPACHHFRLRRADVENNKWTIHIWAMQPRLDASVYHQWKSLYDCKLHSRIIREACRRHLGRLRPITVRQPLLPHWVYKTTAAISPPNDLVVFHFDRVKGTPEVMDFFWNEHNPGLVNALKRTEVRGRLKHFRKVAIHYSVRHFNALERGPFRCRCPRATTNCGDYTACPLSLACFLDFFKHVEEFYFILDPSVKGGKKFVAEYKEMITQQDMQGISSAKQDGKVAVEKIHITRFVDRDTEYLLHAPPKFMKKMLHDSPFVGPCGPRECLINAIKIFTSKRGNEPFQRSLEDRQQVKFGLLLPYTRPSKKTSV